MNMKEIKELPDYFITEQGLVYSAKSNKYLKPQYKTYDSLYLCFTLIKDKK